MGLDCDRASTLDYLEQHLNVSKKRPRKPLDRVTENQLVTDVFRDRHDKTVDLDYSPSPISSPSSLLPSIS